MLKGKTSQAMLLRVLLCLDAKRLKGRVCQPLWMKEKNDNDVRTEHSTLYDFPADTAHLSGFRRHVAA